MSGTLAKSLRDELVELLAPLAAARDPASYAKMLRSLGHTQAVEADAGLQAALVQAATLIDQLGQLDAAALESWDGAVRALGLGANAVAAVRAAERAIADPALAAQAKDLGLQIANRLVSVYLRRRHPRLHRAAAVLTLIDPVEVTAPSAPVLSNGKITRTPWNDDAFHFERLDDLLSDPGPTGDAYFPNAMAHAADAHRPPRSCFRCHDGDRGAGAADATGFALARSAACGSAATRRHRHA